MGRKWDETGIAYSINLWREVLRVLKPGGHLLAFGGTRTYHRMTCAIEDAGFEIRDGLQWLYGVGFPKSLSISKAIDAAAGAERPVVGFDASRARPNRQYEAGAIGNIGGTGKVSDRSDNGATQTASATDEAKRWKGWGTALKPANEPIVLARKPFGTTVAANIIAHGTGGLNIDACRIAVDEEITNHSRSAEAATSKVVYGDSTEQETHQTDGQKLGRWPANVIMECCGEDPHVEGCSVAVLDAQSGARGAATPVRGTEPSAAVETNAITGPRARVPGAFYDDVGGASRFYYVAKASRSEREAGCGSLPARSGAEAVDREEGSAGTHSPRAGAGRTATQVRNHHPTVKPIALMRWLCRLITPPGGIVLDPFTGSGSTGCAALVEGFRFIGIEREAEYLAIAEARLRHALDPVEESTQLELFADTLPADGGPPPVIQRSLFGLGD
jgi:site-specific DNA-methyltransferase (adenine-specific)